MASSYKYISFNDSSLNGSYRVGDDETVNASIILPDSFDNVTQFKIKFKPRPEAKFEVDPEGIYVPEYTSRPLYYRKENGKAEIKIADNGLVTQQDLTGIYNSLSYKQDQLTAGTGITISYDNVISATGGGGTEYTAGTGITIDNNVISAVSQLPAYTAFNTGRKLTVISASDCVASDMGIDFDSSGDSTISSVDLSMVPISDEYNIAIRVDWGSSKRIFACVNNGSQLSDEFGEFTLDDNGNIHCDSLIDETSVDISVDYLHDPYLGWQ